MNVIGYTSAFEFAHKPKRQPLAIAELFRSLLSAC
jgi:hypothetical protein